jgi:hypothetical protein
MVTGSLLQLSGSTGSSGGSTGGGGVDPALGCGLGGLLRAKSASLWSVSSPALFRVADVVASMPGPGAPSAPTAVEP